MYTRKVRTTTHTIIQDLQMNNKKIQILANSSKKTDACTVGQVSEQIQ